MDSENICKKMTHNKDDKQEKKRNQKDIWRSVKKKDKKNVEKSTP